MNIRFDYPAISPKSPPAALVETVIGRMDASGGFPALTRAVGQIVDALEGGLDDTAALANVVLADLSLTQKVLRLANSAMYAPIGRNITTVSHALMVLGYEAVGYLALGVRLISSLGETGAQSAGAAKALGESLLAGSVATAVAAKIDLPNGEEGVVCALLHRLGQLLVAFYLPEEWRRIQKYVALGGVEEAAARRVLGIGLEELGQMVARKWHMPAKIVYTMSAEGDGAPEFMDERLLAVTRFSNQAARIMTSGDADGRKARLSALATGYAAELEVEGTTLLGAVAEAVDAATAEPLLESVLRDGGPIANVPKDGVEQLDYLRDGLRDIQQAIAEGGTKQEIAAMAVEVMYTGQGLQRAAVFELDPASKIYHVLASLSARAPNPLQGVNFTQAFSPNVVHIALSKNADVYIDNPRDTKIAHRLPDWIALHGLFPFYILPLARDGHSFGFLYGQQKDNVTLDDEALVLLKHLRDLLVSALA